MNAAALFPPIDTAPVPGYPTPDPGIIPDPCDLNIVRTPITPNLPLVYPCVAFTSDVTSTPVGCPPNGPDLAPVMNAPDNSMIHFSATPPLLVPVAVCSPQFTPLLGAPPSDFPVVLLLFNVDCDSYADYTVPLVVLFPENSYGMFL